MPLKGNPGAARIFQNIPRIPIDCRWCIQCHGGRSIHAVPTHKRRSDPTASRPRAVGSCPHQRAKTDRGKSFRSRDAQPHRAVSTRLFASANCVFGSASLHRECRPNSTTFHESARTRRPPPGRGLLGTISWRAWSWSRRARSLSRSAPFSKRILAASESSRTRPNSRCSVPMCLLCIRSASSLA